MLKLYYHPGSPPSRAVMLFLLENNIKFEGKVIDLLKGEHLKPEFTAINPNHTLPTIEDGDFILHECLAILRYLCLKHRDKVPEHWYPQDLYKQARLNQYIAWYSAHLHRHIYDLIALKVFGPIGGIPVNLQKAEVVDRDVADSLSFLEAWLTKGAFIAGDEISIADLPTAQLLVMLTLLDKSLQAYPHVNSWFQAVQRRMGEHWDKVNKVFLEQLVPGIKAALAKLNEDKAMQTSQSQSEPQVAAS